MLANAARADVRATDETEPVEPLLVGQMDAFVDLVHAAPTFA